MPDLNYKITTTAELAGAQSTADALERQIGKAKALKQDFAALQTQLDTTKSSIAAYNEVAAKHSALEAEIAQRVQAGTAARKRINDEIAQSVHTVSQEEVAAATATTESDAETIASKENLRGALRGLGMEFPILHRIVRIATNGIAQAFALAAGAIALWVEKFKEAREETSSWEMPDFQLDKVNAASVSWNGLAEAMERANKAFGSAEGI